MSTKDESAQPNGRFGSWSDTSQDGGAGRPKAPQINYQKSTLSELWKTAKFTATEQNSESRKRKHENDGQTLGRFTSPSLRPLPALQPTSPGVTRAPSTLGSGADLILRELCFDRSGDNLKDWQKACLCFT